MFPGSQPPQKPQSTTDNSNAIHQNLFYNIALQQQIANVLSTLQQQTQQPVCMTPLVRFPVTSSNYTSSNFIISKKSTKSSFL